MAETRCPRQRFSLPLDPLYCTSIGVATIPPASRSIIDLSRWETISFNSKHADPTAALLAFTLERKTSPSFFLYHRCPNPPLKRSGSAGAVKDRCQSYHDAATRLNRQLRTSCQRKLKESRLSVITHAALDRQSVQPIIRAHSRVTRGIMQRIC